MSMHGNLRDQNTDIIASPGSEAAVPILENRVARRIVLNRQGLAAPPYRRQSKSALQASIEQLGFVQIDSINTVERAHHMILFARNQTYNRKNLAQLLERDRALFENWTHDASIIPTCFYPYWKRHFKRHEPVLRKRWETHRRDGYEHHFDDILERIAKHGPVLSRDLAKEEVKGGDGWWDWHPSKTALEYLWRTGALAVTRRDGFQKVYDLSERVIPDAHRGDDIDDDALIDWACTNALDRLGFATCRELAGFWGLISTAEARAWTERQNDDDVIALQVTPAGDTRPRTYFAKPELLATSDELASPPPRLRLISPFDPLIRDRDRLSYVFGFDYRIEVFVPREKRKYGYYVFPMLEFDRFVGRIDLKCMRDDNALCVTGIWWEPGVSATKSRKSQLDSELDRVRRFTGCDEVRFEC